PTGSAVSSSGVGVAVPGAAATDPSRSPQAPQNFSLASAGTPHEGQATESVAPHSVQKRRSARVSWLQDGQRIAAWVAVTTTQGANRGTVRPGSCQSSGIKDSAPVPAFGTRPWRDMSGPGPAAHPEPAPESGPQLLPIPPLPPVGTHCRGGRSDIVSVARIRAGSEARSPDPRTLA